MRSSGARSLFAHPAVYDAAFCWDRSREASTFLEVGAALAGRPIRSAAELACGSGPLARRWSERGVRVWGVDRSRAAIERARALSSPGIPASHWIRSDLRAFRLPKPVDMLALPLDGLTFLTGRSDLREFLRSARSSLRPRGVLLADLILHPPHGAPLPNRNSWTVRLLPSGRIHVDWRSVGRPWGRPRRRWEVGQVVVTAPDGSREVYEDRSPHVVLSVEELQHISQEAGGFAPMSVFSVAAHRGRAAPPHPVSRGRGAIGPRLVAWVRT